MSFVVGSYDNTTQPFMQYFEFFSRNFEENSFRNETKFHKNSSQDRFFHANWWCNWTNCSNPSSIQVRHICKSIVMFQ